MTRISVVLRKNPMKESDHYILNISDNINIYNLYTCKITNEENLQVEELSSDSLEDLMKTIIKTIDTLGKRIDYKVLQSSNSSITDIFEMEYKSIR